MNKPEFQTFGTELGALREAQDRALDLLRQMLTDPEIIEEIKALAVERWEAGKATYEDATWEKEEEELYKDIYEELADGINYAAVWSLQFGSARY